MFQTAAVNVTASEDNVEFNLLNNDASDTDFRPLISVGTDIDCESEPIVTILDAQTGQVVSQFQAFEPGFRGGVRTVMSDVDGDGIPEVLVAPGLGRVGEVRVFDLSGVERLALRTQPYGSSFRAGVSLAAADVDGDGIDDLITSQSRGSGRVQVFRGLAGAAGWETVPYRAFDPYGPAHINGVSVAAADVGTFSNGLPVSRSLADGRHEIAVTSGPGVVQPARVFDVSVTPVVISELRGEPLGNTRGATISAGLYDSDGIDDVVISGNASSGSLTAVYSGRTDLTSAPALQRYAAFADIASNAPVFSTGVDTDGDGRIDEIVSLQGAGGVGGTRIFDTSGALAETVSVLRGPLQLASPAHQSGSASFGPQVVPLVTTATGLQYRDLVVGSGAPATAGQVVTVHYVGSRQNGEVFDSSRTRGTPFTFTLGTGQVIAGWDEGVAGMRLGGRRTLIIPANLAYGNTPPGSIIQPGDTLVFDVELLAAS